MKRYNDPELEIVTFDVADVTNNFGGDNEVSADSLFNEAPINW